MDDDEIVPNDCIAHPKFHRFESLQCNPGTNSLTLNGEEIVMNVAAHKSDRRFVCIGSMLLSLMFFSSSVGQSVPSLKFEKSPLNDISREIGNLIRLQWAGDNIEFSQDWPEIDEQTLLEKQIQAMVDRGWDRERAERLTSRRAGFGFRNKHPLDKQFHVVVATMGTSTGGGGGNGYRHYDFTNKQVAGSMERHDDEFELEFRDATSFDQRFILRDPDGKSLSFLYIDKNLTIDFRQLDSGQVRLAVIEDEPHMFVAQNYRSLVNDQPEVVNQLLSPLFTHLGIIEPYTSQSPEILNALMNQLVAQSDSDNIKVGELVEAIDSTREKRERDAALQQLADGFDFWKASIESFSTNEVISEETRRMLKELIAAAPDHRARTFIKQNGLMKQPKVFIGLLSDRKKGTDNQLIIEHLQSLTQQEFGDDVKAWNKWLRDQ